MNYKTVAMLLKCLLVLLPSQLLRATRDKPGQCGVACVFSSPAGEALRREQARGQGDSGSR